MASPVEIVQTIARQRARGETNPLLALHSLAARTGVRISHLPINQRLAQAWVTLTGDPFRQHQSLALSALRRGEPLALMGNSGAARQTLHLLALELVQSERNTTALLLAYDQTAALQHLAELDRLNKELGSPLLCTFVGGEQISRAAPLSHLIITTPNALHDRLLRRHDRAWNMFWPRLRLILLPDMHRMYGVATAHLGNLFMRSLRLAPVDPPPTIAVTLAEIAGADEVLLALSGQHWRIINADDAPRPTANLALWRAGTDRLRDTTTLAVALSRAGYRVHVTCQPLDIAALWATIGTDAPGVSIGNTPTIAQVQLLMGYPTPPTAMRGALESGALLTVLLLGPLPAERTLARLATTTEGFNELLNQLRTWTLPPANAYIAAQHLICAASESPLSAEEINLWDADQIVARLVKHNHLLQLPGATPAWQPLTNAGDPYLGFALHVAGSPPIRMCDERGTVHEQLDPAAFDRWGFLGAALPPLLGGMRVIDRDEEQNSITLRSEQTGRRTLPIRRCTVTVREERSTRSLRGRTLGWGRVVVDEEIFGYREVVPGSAINERALNPVLVGRWIAPACWIDLPTALNAEGQMVGWSLAYALPLRTLFTPNDLVPAYDAALQRIYLVDAQPGGNGLAAWIYAQLEELLPAAYDVALDGRNDPLFELGVRIDKDWLLLLLGGEARPTLPEQHETLPPPATAPVEPTPPVPQPASVPLPPIANVLPPPAAAPAERTPPLPSAPPPPPRNGATTATNEKRRGRGGAAQRTNATPKPPVPTERTDHPLRSSSHQPPPPVPPAAPVPPPAVPPPPIEILPDAAAMLVKVRRMRQAAEAQQQSPTPPVSQPPAPAEGNLRFAPGDQIFCLPYGYGEVVTAHLENQREIVNATFPDYGDLTLDTSVSMVRRIGAH